MDTCRVCLNPLLPHTVGGTEEFSFVACKTCGSVTAEPFPTPETRDAYIRALDPQPRHMVNPLAQIANARRTILKAVGHTPPAGKTFLAVNSRHGYAVAAAKEMGYKAQGLDEHAFLVDFARKNYGARDFMHASVESYARAEGRADVIYAMQTFSEQFDLESYTSSLRQMLNPGGTLYIEEPDGNSMWLPKRFEKAGFIMPPINFIYPSFNGMRQLLARHGLKIRRKFFTWGPYMRLVVGK
jgi:SAM-dependent methyltransferase